MVLLSAVLNRRKLTERFAQIAGIALMLTAGHNLIWRWPEQMAYFYTDAHVQLILQQTEELSIVWGASVFAL